MLVVNVTVTVEVFRPDARHRDAAVVVLAEKVPIEVLQERTEVPC